MMTAAAFSADVPPAFAVGEFAMLHPGSMATTPARPHPDAGRIGRIERMDDHTLWVCFRDHAHPLLRSHRILPRGAWLPVPASMVEQTSTECGAYTWRYDTKAAHIARVMGWPIGSASVGG